ncbi:MAG TPA: glycosyltransferase [Gammaproteobacteria bacterium]|nr:glycosyltransferase [Gammaproteobacteria bacterium]
MNEALVSVVIPAFNSEKYITECIDSVLNQSYKNTEILIIDDGSTDGTVNIVSGYINDKIKLFHQKNSGSGAARNHGVKQASGEWIAFIDADDIWLPNKLEKQLGLCSNHIWSHTDLYFHGDVYPKHTKTTEFTEKHSGFILKNLLVENSIGTSSVVIKKKTFDEYGGFDTNLRALQDWDLWLRVAEKHQVCYFDEPLVYYRVHSSSVSRNVRKTWPYHFYLINRIFSQKGIANNLQELKYEALSRSSKICSQIAEQEGDYLFSCSCAIRSLIYQPLDISNYSRLIKIMIKAILSFFRKEHK